MNRTTPKSVMIAGALLLTFSCVSGSSEDAGAGQDSPRADSGTLASNGNSDAGADASLAFVGSFTSWPGESPMAGAAVCWRDENVDLCTTADADGNYTITGVPTGTAGAITVDGTGVIPTVLPITVGDRNLLVSSCLDSIGFSDALYNSAGLVKDPALGTICVQTADASGTTITLSPATGWQGPFYLNAAATGFDLSASQTTDWGIAYFLHVDPAAGPFAIVAARNTTPCQTAVVGTELPEIEAFAGKSTQIGVYCD